MRAVVQRVTKASVTIESHMVAAINQGLLVFVGIAQHDTEVACDYLINKIVNLRVFQDEEGKMNKSVRDIAGQILLVSQFTLYANTAKGNRPSFVEAMVPEKAQILFDIFVKKLRMEYSFTQQGVFGANMQVTLCNDGPVTIILESKDA